MGIRDEPVAPGSPWQIGYAVRLIGTIRWECLDHLIVFGEAHLRWVFGEFAAYYNESRTHSARNQDAPPSIECLGVITSRPVLDGLHHHIAECKFSVHRLIAVANSSRLDSDREQQGESHQNQHNQSHLSEWGPVVRENRAPAEGSCSESAAHAYLPSVKWRHTHVSDVRLPHAIGFPR
jgi:hypothetical protein